MMNVLFAILAAIGALFAPAAADVPSNVNVQTPVGYVSSELGALDARLVFVVEHAGLEAPALLTLEGDDTQWVHAVTLKPGRNVLIEDAFATGEYTITLQNLVTAASNHVELGPCGDDTTVVTMETVFRLDHFAIGSGSDVCEPAEA